MGAVTIHRLLGQHIWDNDDNDMEGCGTDWGHPLKEDVPDPVGRACPRSAFQLEGAVGSAPRQGRDTSGAVQTKDEFLAIDAFGVLAIGSPA